MGALRPDLQASLNETSASTKHWQGMEGSHEVDLQASINETSANTKHWQGLDGSVEASFSELDRASTRRQWEPNVGRAWPGAPRG